METSDELVRWDVLSQACPTRQVLSRIGEKWTMLVVTALTDAEVLRFSELRRRVEGVTQKMLTQTLRALERDGAVERTVYPTVPVTVEYRLTPLGRGLAGTVDVLRQWAYANIDQIESARAAFDNRTADNRTADNRTADNRTADNRTTAGASS
jgi:DNA-binding HxlR family transcriptional regulator